MYSDEMPEHPSVADDGLWSIALPSSPGSIHYLQTPFRASSTPHRITVTFRVNSSSDANYNAKVDPNAWNPATFHIFIERRGDDLTKDFYRWWALDGFYVLGSRDNSVITIEVPLSYERWTSVLGHQNEEEFESTLNDLAFVGMTFGGTNFFGHGVNMLAGRSVVTLIDYRVE